MNRTKYWLAFLFVIALVLTFFPLLLSMAHAEDVPRIDADVTISAPEDMPNPATGEAGTWIPRWVEREHVLDARKLQTCRDDVEFADAELIAREDQLNALELTLEETRLAKDEAKGAARAAEQSAAKKDTKLDRRLHAVWALVSVAAVAIGTTTGALFLR